MNQVHRARRAVYEVIRDDKHTSAANRVFNALLAALILLTVVFVIVDSFSGRPLWYIKLSLGFELVTIVVFTIEYLLRLWTAPEMAPALPPGRARLKYALTFPAVVDFLATVPNYIFLLLPVSVPALRMLRLVRLFMILKVHRYTNALGTIVQVVRRKASELVSSLFTVLLLMVVFSALIYNIENPYQPEVFSNIFSGLWWAISTITTIGYGDIYPVTIAGKILSSVLAILGIGLVAVPTGVISAGFVEVLQGKNQGGAGGLPKDSPAAHIAAFKQLLDSGAITPQEFEAQKQALLAQSLAGMPGDGDAGAAEKEAGP